MNNDSFLIEEYDLDIAKNICKLIKDPALRNKAVANVAAANLAKKYFQDCEVDIASGLHNICQVLEDINISDIYIKDNYIDVRLYFNDNELFVPKSHFEQGILPTAYMFIKVSEDLSSGLVTGFILPASVDTTNEINGFYHVQEESLISFYDVDSNLINKFDDELPDNIDSLIFDYLDNKLSDNTEFYKLMVESREARIKLQNAYKAKIVFDFISIPSAETKQEEPVEEISEIEELEPVDLLEEAAEATESFESLDLEASDISLDVHDDVEPFDLGPQEENVEVKEDEPEIAEIEEDASTLNLDFETDSIKMLGAGDYEEQSLSDFASNDFQESSLDKEDDEITIGIVDSSKLTFDDEPPVLESNETPKLDEPEDIKEETPEIAISEEIIEEDNVPQKALDIIDEPEEEETVEVENNDFDFSTNITPSLDTIEEEEDFSEDLLNSLDTEENNEAEEAPVEVTESESTEEIDTLFNPEEQQQEVITNVKPKSKNLLVPIVGLIAILGIVGYYSYTKFMVQQPSVNDMVDNTQNAIQPVDSTETTSPIEDAMPVETVENVKIELNTNEGNTVSIPAIEQNLDASITVSNLRVEFEIPAAYKTSKTAERYFTKMGKIVQLNLKTELLLLTKQPITNKIAVELEYNKSTQKFDVKGLVASSGEPTIDDLILRTVKNAMNINLNMNMSIFGTVSGNPILVIKL